MLQGVTPGQAIARLLFFAAESGTVAGWVIYSGEAVEVMYYRGILIDSFKPLDSFVMLSFFALPLVSLVLLQSDRLLAKIGLATFFGVLALSLIFRLLGDVQ